MNISSTPFIRNDYWPDYNDINVLNQKINEVENELSLTNIRLSTDIENVSNNLNTYANDQANTTIANNIIVNNINANYAVGKFVNFGNANFDNAYVENLTVNKPVFDITLNTPHIENVTSLGGNIYDANMFNVSITGGNVAFNNVNVDDLTAVNATISNVNILDGDVNLNSAVISNANAANATISNLFVNVSPEPIQSSAVLGYDPQGRVIPVEAIYDVGFPESANYLFTDEHGTAFAGVAATEVSAVDNLITAQAVQNSYNDINNTFSDVNNFINDSYNDINNTFNDVNNTFNDVNNFVNGIYNDINNTFNDTNNFVNDSYNEVNNTFNDVNNTVNDIDILLKALIGVSTSDAKQYVINYSNQSFPELNNAGLDNTFTYISFTSPADTTGYNVSLDSKNPIYAKVVEDTLTYSSDLIITNDFMNRVFNTNMFQVFSGCANLNQNILIPNSVTEMRSSFSHCTSFNQNILIPNSVTNMSSTFFGCSSLNQNILIPNSVTSMMQIFSRCTSLNQNILIPNSVTTLEMAFYGCSSLNQNILIPNSVTNVGQIFMLCTSLNQNILIPNSVSLMVDTFSGCTSLNQNILIPNSVTGIGRIFNNCTSLNQNILIPNSVTSMSNIFKRCTSLNQDDMYIYSQNVTSMNNAYVDVQRIGNIHIPTSVPKDVTNVMYNSLVNGYAGYTFAPENVINDLPVDIEQWPPV